MLFDLCEILNEIMFDFQFLFFSEGIEILKNVVNLLKRVGLLEINDLPDFLLIMQELELSDELEHLRVVDERGRA